MRALGAGLAGIHRRPLGIAVLLVVALVFAAAALVNRVAGFDAEARAELTAQRDRLAADIATVAERTDAVRAVETAADECVREAAAALEPAVAASARFSAATVEMGESVITRVVPAPSVVLAAEVRPAATATVLLVPEAGTATRLEIIDDVDRLADLRATVGADAADARLTALERHAACDAAERAVEAVLVDVTTRTDQVIAASGMAPADAVAKLRAARDDVLAESEEEPGIGALPAWLAAASEVESTHAAAEAAAAEAAARAAAAAEAAESARRAEAIPVDPRGPEWYIVKTWDLEQPTPSWCDIDPNAIDHIDPVTGEPVYLCD
jgi:hypothetical protein